MDDFLGMVPVTSVASFSSGAAEAVDLEESVGEVLPSLVDTQNLWLQHLLTNEAHCDAAAVLGPERQRVPFLGALLANISAPFASMIFGNFKEATTREIHLPDLDVPAFQSILRASVGLEPGLKASNVVPTLQAAGKYMIPALAVECRRYMRDLRRAEDALEVLTACILCAYSLEEEIERLLWRVVISSCSTVLQSEAFLHTHGIVLHKLVQLDEFCVSEEALWSRLSDWARGIREKPYLVLQEGAQPETASPDSLEEEVILRPFLNFMRFPLMDKGFFADKVAGHLTREEERSVLQWHLLGRDPAFSRAARVAGPPLVQVPIRITSASSMYHSIACLDEAKKLPDGNALLPLKVAGEIQVQNPCGSTSISFALLGDAVQVKQVKLTFASTLLGPWQFSLEAESSKKSSGDCQGTFVSGKKVQEIEVQSLSPSEHYKLTFKHPLQAFFADSQIETLVGLQVFGELPRDIWVTEQIAKKGPEWLIFHAAQS